MKLLSEPRLQLVGKTLMDLAKASVIASELFKTPSMKMRLIAGAIISILSVSGWLIYPGGKEEDDVP